MKAFLNRLVIKLQREARYHIFKVLNFHQGVFPLIRERLKWRDIKFLFFSWNSFSWTLDFENLPLHSYWKKQKFQCLILSLSNYKKLFKESKEARKEKIIKEILVVSCMMVDLRRFILNVNEMGLAVFIQNIHFKLQNYLYFRKLRGIIIKLRQFLNIDKFQLCIREESFFTSKEI